MSDKDKEKKILCRVCLTEHGVQEECPEPADGEDERRRKARLKIWDEEIETEERGRLEKEREPAKKRNRFGLG